MPYPNQYFKDFDLRKAQDDGDKLSATELCVELDNIGSSVNQVIAFLRAITTVDMKIQPSQISGTTFVIEDEQTATASQTVITYANSVTVDPLVATVGVFIDGDRLPASQTTVGATTVTVTPALTAGDNIMLEIHDNADSVFSVLNSISTAMGASLIGIEDVAGVYAASNVEVALEEVRLLVDSFITAVGDLTKYLKADVAIPFEIDQDASGFTIKNLAAAVDPNDPVILQQIQDVLAILTNLESTFLPLVGGVMQGPINMGGSRIINLPAPSADADAARKIDVDNVDVQLDDFIPTAGNKSVDRAGQSQNVGPISFNNAASDTASAPQNNTSTVDTISGIALPDADDHVVNKLYVDNADANLQTQINDIDLGGLAGTIGGTGIDAVGLGIPVANFDNGGIHNFSNLAVIAVETPNRDLVVRSEQDIDINGSITVSNTQGFPGDLTLTADGDIFIDAALTAQGDILIQAGGDINIGVDAAAVLTATDNHIKLVAGGAINATVNATLNCESWECTSETASTYAWTVNALAVDETGPGGSEGGDFSGISTGTAAGGGAGAMSGGAGGNGDDPAGGKGSGASGAGGFPRMLNMHRPYLQAMERGGRGGIGNGAAAGRAGGFGFIYCGGDLSLTGANFVHDGKIGGSSTLAEPGGGGGGAIRIVSNGTLTDGTFDVSGGSGRDGGSGDVDSGGGGGGYLAFIATAFAGAQTSNVAGGGGGGGGAQSGDAGLVDALTLTAQEITDLRTEGYWRR